MTEPFASIHRHGFVRVAAATPSANVGDVAANVAAILQLARAADDADADLVVFPELCLSGYAIDDLLLQDALLERIEAGIAEILTASRDWGPVLIIGAPLRRQGRLYNCAVVIARGALLGIVPKSFLPNYREYYEKRWFAGGQGLSGMMIRVGARDVPFGTDLLFRARGLDDFIFHVEVCEDYWAPIPPSTYGALAGALILCNLSASNIVVGKSRTRHQLSAVQSARCTAAYVYSAAGSGESTTDLAWDGEAMIYEMGDILAQSDRFAAAPGLLIADVDAQRLRLERLRTGTFNDAAVAASHPERGFRAIWFDSVSGQGDVGLRRPVRRFPFVPNDPAMLDADSYEAFHIQVAGLAQRFTATGGRHMVIGVSGGLDSTHALIVAAKACDRLGLPRSTILGFTMPGFATGDATRSQAWSLMRALGVEAEELDIKPAALQMLKDMGHPFGRGEPVYDVTFENVQAGLRTDYLFRLATSGKDSSWGPAIFRSWRLVGAPMA